MIGTRGYISYNPVLAIRQLSYPMRGAPLEEELAPIPPRCETHLPTTKPPFMRRKEGSKLGPILGKHKRGVGQLVPSLEGGKIRNSIFMQKISKCSLDRDKGLYQL